MKNQLKSELGNSYDLIENSRMLLRSIPKVTYSFMNQEDFEKLIKKDTCMAMKVYWTEIIARSHMAGCSGLKRIIDWINILEDSKKNYIGYCSGLRGLMECAGDTFHGLNSVAVSLSMNNKVINQAISGKLFEVIISHDLEKRIIHFTHASKTFHKTTKQDEHKPERPYEYVKVLEENSEIPFYEIYGELCDVVHPASSSLGYNFDGFGNTLEWNGKRDRQIVNLSLNRHKNLIIELLERSINPIFVLLKTLTKFDVSNFHINSINGISLNHLPVWRKIENEFI